ncbi:MAG: hypothetical protein MI725_02495 [Pirellulales bacterium]|nr:hypothetical protein [Pirellulales bacterium]
MSAIILALSSAVLVHQPGGLRAATLAQWETFGTPGDQLAQAATNEAPGISGVDLTRNGGLAPRTGANSFNSKGWASNAELTPTVVNTGAFVELGITIQPGLSANLESLLLGSRSSGSGPAMIGVFTSVDSFTTPIFVIDQTATTGFGNVQGTGFANSNIDLSAFNGITGSFLVRFKNVSGANTATTARAGDMDLESTWRIGDFLEPGVGFSVLQITGTVIPEPASWVLLCGLGCLATSARYRNSR